MWKKVLAGLSMPIWLFVALMTVQAATIVFPAHVATAEGKSGSYLVGGLFGAGLFFALFVWLLFFWGRWIWRVFRTKPLNVEWPE